MKRDLYKDLYNKKPPTSQNAVSGWLLVWELLGSNQRPSRLVESGCPKPAELGFWFYKRFDALSALPRLDLSLASHGELQRFAWLCERQHPVVSLARVALVVAVVSANAFLDIIVGCPNVVPVERWREYDVGVRHVLGCSTSNGCVSKNGQQKTTYLAKRCKWLIVSVGTAGFEPATPCL